ncbi:MAG: MBL fold metallo-hydrolase [Muribaculaceae bacterium]|nr:MBL fold metallo-hydrolase [Muribaculaceae bacterium]
MIVSRFTFNLFGVNTYILWDADSREAVIIDPGMTKETECKQIDDFVRENSLKLCHMINTHMHIDHSFGVSYISRKYGLPLEANKEDQFLAERIQQQAKMFGLPISVEDLNINTALVDGQIINVGSEELRVIHVPGHSPGGIAFYSPESGFLISGDSLFQRSIGRTDLPGGDYNQLINSLNVKLMTLPGETVVYPGHGPETMIKDEKDFNPYL